MNAFWIAAAAMALVTFAVHTFIGTPYAVPPLLAARESLPKATIWLNYMCWHIVTGVLLILSACLVAIAFQWLDPLVLLPCAAMFAWIAVMSVSTTVKAGIPVLQFPASYLGATTALLVIVGFLR